MPAGFEEGLYHCRRYEFELVPGCAGQGNFGTDDCFDPANLEGLGDFYRHHNCDMFLCVPHDSVL